MLNLYHNKKSNNVLNMKKINSSNNYNKIVVSIVLIFVSNVLIAVQKIFYNVVNLFNFVVEAFLICFVAGHNNVVIIFNKIDMHFVVLAGVVALFYF